MKLLLVFVSVFALAHSFAVESDEAPENVNAVAPEQARKTLPLNAVCDPNIDMPDCQCFGKWQRCDCPWFSDEPCRCTRGYKWHCIHKLSCPNKDEWGPYNREEDELERSPR
uniref:Secretory peptide n=1 Tax=Heteropoda venatoria TaxID=152925 RepID=A0A088BP97_HETVE|nr:secretory peptide [Heteropoda venatoria]